MKCAISLLPALLVCAACGDLPTGVHGSKNPDPPSLSAQPQTLRLVVPIAFDAWACVETVSLQGTILAVLHSNSTDHGTQGKALFLQRLTGYGQSTGYEYKAIGISNAAGVTAEDGAKVYTEVFSFRLVSRAASLHVKMRIHTTVNANGDLTADVSDFSVVCHVR